MQSALGRVLLRKLPDWVGTFVANMRPSLPNVSARCRRYALPNPRTGSGIPIINTTFSFVPNVFGRDWNRDRIMSEIAAAGVPCFSGSCSEIYLERAFAEEMRPSLRLPVARELGETSLMFLVHPTLLDVHIEMTCDVVKRVMEMATA